MDIKVHLPRYQVLVTKTVKRKTVDGYMPTSARFQGTPDAIDLAPWLGDGSSISTVKGINQAAGGFSITVPDMPITTTTGGLDTLYGVIEPMDLVQIKVQHSPSTWAGNKAPVIMRGFVSKVSRQEGMSPDGKPGRFVTINGQDYGKIWQIIQIFYGPSYIFGEDILSAFKLMDKFGAGFKNAMSNVEFLQTAIDKIINPFLQRLLPEGSGFPLITLNTDHVVEGAVGIAGIQSAEGTIYQLMRNYLDVGPFNELFLADDDAGVHCIYRQNPAIGLDGYPLAPDVTDAPAADPLIVPDANTLNIIDIPAEDVIALDVSRSDEGVGNYYWVSAPGFSLNSDTLQRQMGYSSAERATIDLSEYPNSASALYGTRLMWIDTKLGGPAVTNTKSGLTEPEQEQRDGNLFDWLRTRREFLVAQNRDNSILESGTLRMRGNENIRAGNYVRVLRGNFSSVFYVTSVSHNILPLRGFYSTLTLSRGTGFANRVRMAGGVDSPYLSELTGL
jgi:hypothetical protein